MTRVRALMWGAVAVAAAAWAAVVVTAMREETVVARRAPDAEVVAVQATPVEPTVPPQVADDAFVDRPAVPLWPIGSVGEVPADRLERGDATLRIRLIGDPGREPIEMNVRLWRLGVPGDEEWSSGDEVRASFRVPKDGAVVEHLPPGRYRLQCDDLRGGADDPPAFVLVNRANEHVAEVQHRRWFRLRLRLVDEAGDPLDRAEQSAGASCHGEHSPQHLPGWATPRRSADEIEVLEYGSGYSCTTAEGKGTPVDADAGGCFDLGMHLERGTLGSDTWSRGFRSASRAAIWVRAGDGVGVDTTFVGVAPRLDVLVAHVTHPDGTQVDPSTTKIVATSYAVRCAWDPPPDAWRSVPVRVTVACDGFEPLTFDWTAATADTPRVLVPKSPK